LEVFVASTEAVECGGAGFTCLTHGDGAEAASVCVRACTPHQPATGCADDQVCAGWWYTRRYGEADAPGCLPFCHADAECPAGRYCGRAGECRARPVDLTLRLDGEPCDPYLEPAAGPSSQCRGVCLQVWGATEGAHQGLCGSLIDLRRTTTCPDRPDRVHAAGSEIQDDLMPCVFASCTCDRDCTAPLRCLVFPGGTQHVCSYLDTSMGEHGTPQCG
jgi:hypothetical protein